MCEAWEFRDARGFEVSGLARPGKALESRCREGSLFSIDRKKGRGGFLGTPKKARLRAAPQRL